MSGAQSSCARSKTLQIDLDPFAAVEIDGLHEVLDKIPTLCRKQAGLVRMCTVANAAHQYTLAALIAACTVIHSPCCMQSTKC